jgi:hypothetical protein
MDNLVSIQITKISDDDSDSTFWYMDSITQRQIFPFHLESGYEVSSPKAKTTEARLKVDSCELFLPVIWKTIKF